MSNSFSSKTFKAFVLVAAGSAAVVAPALAQPLPEAGRPGCYAKIAYPPEYKTVTERVPGAPVVSYRDLPPVVEHYAKQVLATPARVEHETIAPVYRTTWRWIEVPGPARLMSSPPIYRTITERQLITPAHLAWRPGRRRPRIRRGRRLRPRRRLAGASDRRGALPRACARPLYCRSPPRADFTRPPVHGPRRATPRQGSRSRLWPSPAERSSTSSQRPTARSTPSEPSARRAASGSSAPDPCGSSLTAYWPARRDTGWAPIVCTPHQGAPYHAPVRPLPAPVHRSQSYGPGALFPASGYGGTGGYGAAPVQHVGHAYRPDEILAPTPTYPATDAPTLVPAPYDVGHPARR